MDHPQSPDTPPHGRRAEDGGSPDRRGSGGAAPRTPGEMGGVIDRRVGLDRRAVRDADGKPPSGLERRRGAGRRLSDSQRAADEGEMTPEQFLFLMAVDAFKQANRVTFPTWTDVLEIVRLLGYRKTMPSELNLRNAEDWRERANTPSNVRPKGWERRFSKDELRELQELADELGDEDDAIEAA